MSKKENIIYAQVDLVTPQSLWSWLLDETQEEGIMKLPPKP